MTRPQAGAVVTRGHRPDRRPPSGRCGRLQQQEVADGNCVRNGIDGHDPETVPVRGRLVGEDPRSSVRPLRRQPRRHRRLRAAARPRPHWRGWAWVALADQRRRRYPTKLSVLLPPWPRPASPPAMAAPRRRRRTRDRRHRSAASGGFASTLLINAVTGSLRILQPYVVAAPPFPPGTATDPRPGRRLRRRPLAGYRRRMLSCRTTCSTAERDRRLWPDTLPDALDGLRAVGGPLRLVDEYVGGRWAWRVQMARTSRERHVPADAVPWRRRLPPGVWRR